MAEFERTPVKLPYGSQPGVMGGADTYPTVNPPTEALLAGVALGGSVDEAQVPVGRFLKDIPEPANLFLDELVETDMREGL